MNSTMKAMLAGDTSDREIDFLYLNEQDMIRAGVTDAAKCVNVMGEVMTLLEEGDFLMGGPHHDAHGLMLEFPRESRIRNFPLNDAKDRRFISMPAYLGGRFHIAGEKWYGSNGRNRRRGLPRSILMVTLNDVETGAPLAYMSANLLSSMRTGAMPGLAAKLLARKDSEVLALIGPGVINRACFRAIMTSMKKVRTVRLKGSSVQSRSAQHMKAFIEKKYPQIEKVEICATLEEAVRGADIVNEAVSCKDGEWPCYRAEWFKPGALVVSTSTFNMDLSTITGFTKVVDNYGMYQNYSLEDKREYDENGLRKPSGCMGEDFVHMVEDRMITRESIAALGDVVTGKYPGRKSEDEIIMVGIEGMPVEDVAWGYECYQEAIKEGIGTKLNLWDQPMAF